MTTGVAVIFEPNMFYGKDAQYVNIPGHDVTVRFTPYWNNLNGTELLIPLMDIEKSDWHHSEKNIQVSFFSRL